ncbi:hypothetical protein FS837_004155 [Tulasnella sp. UAMH 9824]|nr:hypothetical protein FS837_004155 [Tulasnella sp. UAMH 9824]
MGVISGSQALAANVVDRQEGDIESLSSEIVDDDVALVRAMQVLLSRLPARALGAQSSAAVAIASAKGLVSGLRRDSGTAGGGAGMERNVLDQIRTEPAPARDTPT